MRVSQLIHAMDKDDIIVIDDYNAPNLIAFIRLSNRNTQNKIRGT